MLADHFDRVGNLGPMIERTRARRAIVRIEAGLRGWMRLMQRAEELRLWKKQDPDDPARAFRLLHYYRSRYAVGRIEPRFLLPGLDPSDGQRYAYLDERRALESPPAETVAIEDDPHTPLEFLDHGNPLHDALLAAWTKIGKAVPSSLKLRFPAGHPLAAADAKGSYLVAILSWVPGVHHFEELDRTAVLERVQEARVRLEQKAFWDGLQRMEEDLRADRRWLNSLFTPDSTWSLHASRRADGRWRPGHGRSLFTPWCLEARVRTSFWQSAKAFRSICCEGSSCDGIGLLLHEMARAICDRFRNATVCAQRSVAAISGRRRSRGFDRDATGVARRCAAQAGNQ